jgi:polar amino acid transport system substrate-binding protein
MKSVLMLATLLLAAVSLQAQDRLDLGNDPWPPFVIEGEEQGTAERLVCEALVRAGWQCGVRVDEWPVVLEKARTGELDGIAAVWKSPERERFLAFSEPYLTNRMIAVTRSGAGFDVDSLEQLSGMRVALVKDFAYGDDIEAARAHMQEFAVDSDLAGMHAVRLGQAHAAIVDELIARRYLEQGRVDEVELGDTALTFRELHFGVSLAHPHAEEIVQAFNRSFQAMLADGSINEILGLDWLIADIGNDGDLDFVLRDSVSPDQLDDPMLPGSAYAYRQKEQLEFAHPGWQGAGVGYQVNGIEHDSLAAALESAYGRKRVCGYERWSRHIVCSETKSQ